MAPNVGYGSPGRGQTVAEQDQISRSNSTLNMFLGARVPQWMTGSASRDISSSSKPMRRTQQPPSRPRKQSLDASRVQGVPASQPSRLVSNVAGNSTTTGTILAEDTPREKFIGENRNQSTVLPSPAPSDEATSPAVTEAHNSPNPMALALAIETPTTSALAQNAAEQQPSNFSAVADQRGLAIAPGPAQTCPDPNGTRARDTVEDEHTERAKRRRIAADQSAAGGPSTSIDDAVLQVWLSELDNYIFNSANYHPVAQRRLATLRDALECGDSFFVALHQVFMMWGTNLKGAKYVMQPFLTGDVLDQACQVLMDVLKRNEGFDLGAMRWLADFPGPLLNEDGSLSGVHHHSSILRDRLGAVGNFLKRLAADWQHLMGVGPERGYPLRAKELIEALGLTSPVLLHMLFTCSRRSLGISDLPGIAPIVESLYKVFRDEQQVCLDQKMSQGQKLALETKFITRYRHFSSAALSVLRGQGNQAPGLGQGHGQNWVYGPEETREASSSTATQNSSLLLPQSPQPPFYLEHPQQQFQAQANSGDGLPAYRFPPHGQVTSQPNRTRTNPLPSLRPTPSQQQQYQHMPSRSREIAQQLGTVPLSVTSPANASASASSPPAQSAHFSPMIANAPQAGGCFPSSSLAGYQQCPGFGGFANPLETQFASFMGPSLAAVSPLPVAMSPPAQFPATQLFPHAMTQQRQLLQQPQLYPQRRESIQMPLDHQMEGQVSLEQRGGRAELVQQMAPTLMSSAMAQQQTWRQQQQQPGRQLGQQPGQQLNQFSQVVRQPSQPTPLGRNYQVVNLQQRLLPEVGRRITENEYPWEDISAAAASLHMVDILSPPRYLCKVAQPNELETAPHEKYFQFVSKIVVGPVRHSYKVLDKLQFDVPQETFDELARPLTPPGRGYNMCPYSTGTLRYRFRMCEVAQRDMVEGAPTLSGWITGTTMWPETISVLLNKDSFPKLPRKENWRKAKPAELTAHIQPGSNVLSVGVFKKPKAGYRFFGAVEQVTTWKHSEIINFVWSRRPVEPHYTLGIIKDRLQQTNSDSDDVQPEDEMAISLSDPFSSRLCKTPVRGECCRHLDAFDLETWLQTRPTKRQCFHQVEDAKSCIRCDKHGPMWQEPSQVDVWKCPICSADARPNSLCHDRFLQEVCDELVKRGKGNVKSIYVKVDGTWRPKDEGVDDDDSDDSEGERPQKVNPPLQPLSSLPSTTVRSRPEVIVLDDD